MIWNDKDFFHIHTYRCMHAEEVPDEAYVREAVKLGAKSIWFADHAPFPGNPFQNRMDYEDLGEYLNSIHNLKEKYARIIDVKAGLEVEYFPSYDKAGYYQELCNNRKMDFILLGQHMAETSDGSYTISWEKSRQKEEEFRAIGDATVQGIRSGYFNAVAHPDRAFKFCKAWTHEMEGISREIIKAAREYDIPIEINMHSLNMKRCFWPEFWQMVPDTQKIVLGLDAHAVQDLEKRYTREEQFLQAYYKESDLAGMGVSEVVCKRNGKETEIWQESHDADLSCMKPEKLPDFDEDIQIEEEKEESGEEIEYIVNER